MDINAGLVDQRVRTVAEQHAEALSRGDAKVANDAHQLRSRAFVALCVQVLLDIELEQAFELLTDGGHDAGVDALHIDGLADGEFGITIFQGKYKQRLDGQSAFPANEVLKLVRMVGVIFDPNAALAATGQAEVRIEEARSLIREGYIPRVRVVLCNNGQRWKEDGQAHLDNAGFPEEQVVFEHCNHARVIDLLRAPKQVDETLRLTGETLVEAFDFRRVLVGKIAVSEVAALFERHGERLLERNIRRYLGMGSNRVNQAIAKTLRTPDARPDFYFFNNGITLTCRQFRHNALQRSDHQVRVEDLQVINGGQTCITIMRTLRKLKREDFGQTYVLVRLYELGPDDADVVQQITYATNSQNPVDLRDLRANDDIQQRLELGLADLGVTYLRKRGTPKGEVNVTPEEAAEAVLAVWRRKPHLARTRSRDFFGTLYSTIFTEDLRASDVVIAVSLIRTYHRGKDLRREVVEGRYPILEDCARWLPYAAHALAMLIGEHWKLQPKNGDENDLARVEAFNHWHAGAGEVLAQVVAKLRVLLYDLGINPDESSLQRLAATFRRGDIVERLDGLETRAADDFEPARLMLDVASEVQRILDEDSGLMTFEQAQRIQAIVGGESLDAFTSRYNRFVPLLRYFPIAFPDAVE